MGVSETISSRNDRAHFPISRRPVRGPRCAIASRVATSRLPPSHTTAPDKDNDKLDNGNPFLEHELVLDPAFKNSTNDPGIAGCFDAANPVFGPATSLTENASPPPGNGFFDTGATYIGAFKDASDTWATTGKWAVWKAN